MEWGGVGRGGRGRERSGGKGRGRGEREWEGQKLGALGERKWEGWGVEGRSIQLLGY